MLEDDVVDVSPAKLPSSGPATAFRASERPELPTEADLDVGFSVLTAAETDVGAVRPSSTESFVVTCVSGFGERGMRDLYRRILTGGCSGFSLACSVWAGL